MKTLTIIDTFGFFFRSYFALPKLTNSQGFPTGVLTGFINFINELNKDYKSEYILFALDSKGETFRHKIDTNYKANRPEAPQDLKQQLPVAIEWIKKMGFKTCEFSGYEADDIIASATKTFKDKNIKIRIITHDKDLYQLIEDDKVSIFSFSKKMDINEQGCVEKFGIPPLLVRDYLSIVGDSADNIPGVKGIGAKGASKLLSEFGSLDEIYKNIDKISNKRQQQLLSDGKESAFLSKELTSLYSDLKIDENLQDYEFVKQNPLLNIIQELENFEFKKILSTLKLNQKTNEKSLEKQSVKEELKSEKLAFLPILLDTESKLFEVLENFDEKSLVAFDTETNSLHVKKAKIIGFSFASDEQKAYYVPINHSYLGVGEQVSMEAAKKAIKKLFTCKLIGQNLKFDFHIVKTNFDINPPIAFADTMILGWLQDSTSKIGLDAMAKRMFNYQMKPFKQVVSRGKNFGDVLIEDALFYASEDAWMSYKLYKKFENLLENELFKEAKNIENPFLNVLYEMEEEGIKLDTTFLQKLLENANIELKELTKKIYHLSGGEFNINSVPQLRSVLFEKLQLPTGKKTKTGFSTDEDVLNSLSHIHEIIPPLLEYRELYKLKSTYFEPLIKIAKTDKNSRIYTSFLQTGTATGRLASKEPNLQNIPTKTQLGRQTRQAFVPKDGYKLVGLDYSQIELRLLAHFSEDKDMVKAFNEDKDIHLETALKIFGELKAQENRNIAKSINFGLIYGMGARKLAQTLDISTQEAKSYIEGYFASFKTIKAFIKNTQENAKINGFVETILKRRRYFNYQSATPMLLAMYDRESVNTIFQGSAADLIKLAMLKLNNQSIKKYDAKLLLQIHDELIFEVKSQNADEFSEFAKLTMQNVYKLNVPLKTSVSIGENWGELK